MQRIARAYTLTELLIVLGIISVLAAVLFPVLLAAKASASRAVCISNMRQITSAVNLYASDYDDMFVLTSQRPGEDATSRTDRTWVQLVLPYLKTFSVFRCPGDTSTKEQPEATFDQDLIPGDTDSRYYTASMRVNYGFNYQYLSPILMSSANTWMPQPKSVSRVERPAGTLLLVDSLWARLRNGAPFGGGSWLVTPPCRYHDARGLRLDSFRDYTLSEGQVFTTSVGWSVDQARASDVYGNSWPWHSGKMNVATLDGSVRAVAPQKLAAGCHLETAWQGAIVDSDSYLWDLR